MYILIPRLFFVVMLLKSPFMYIADGEGVLDSAQRFPHVRFHICCVSFEMRMVKSKIWIFFSFNIMAFSNLAN